MVWGGMVGIGAARNRGVGRRLRHDRERKWVVKERG